MIKIGFSICFKTYRSVLSESTFATVLQLALHLLENFLHNLKGSDVEIKNPNIRKITVLKIFRITRNDTFQLQLFYFFNIKIFKSFHLFMGIFLNIFKFDKTIFGFKIAEMMIFQHIKCNIFMIGIIVRIITLQQTYYMVYNSMNSINILYELSTTITTS